MFNYIANLPWKIYNVNMLYDVRKGSLMFKHSMDENPMAFKDKYQPHFHENTYELFYFISGDASFMIDNQPYDLRSGAMLLIKPGVVHNISIKSDKVYERVTMRFSEFDLPRNLREKLSKTDNIYFVRNSELSAEILRLDTHYQNLDEDWILYAFRNSLNVILSYLVNYKQFDDKATYDNETKEVMNYIDDNLFNIENLKDLCDNLHISKSALCKRFTEAVGVPIMTYVRIKKLLAAKNMIEEGNNPTEIYKQCGFNDYTTFFRAYKKIFHEKPSLAKA